jgi:4-hydroxy-2-oxoheptanedioate aldolase
MVINHVKAKLAQNQPVFGVFVSSPDPRLIELCGLAGFDYVVIDAEHSPISERECEQLVRACELSGLTPIVRIPDNTPKVILRYLDVGAMGIMVPQVRSVAEAEAAAKAARHFPLGDRGLAPGRMTGYGSRATLREQADWVNRETMVIVQIEHRDAVQQLDGLLEVEGIDAFEMGQADLSQSLGLPGQPDHPLVREYIDRTIQTVIGRGRVLGDTTNDPRTALALLDQGFRMVACHLHKLVIQGGQDFVKQVRRTGSA